MADKRRRRLAKEIEGEVLEQALSKLGHDAVGLGNGAVRPEVLAALTNLVAEKLPEPPHVVVEVHGGVVTSVRANVAGVECTVVDWDNADIGEPCVDAYLPTEVLNEDCRNVDEKRFPHEIH